MRDVVTTFFLMACMGGLGGAQAAPVSPQAERCAQLEADGVDPLPWFCGGIEPALEEPLASACPDSQWIGIRLTRPIGECPRALPDPNGGQWVVSTPFEGGAHRLLKRACLYTWQAPRDQGMTNPRPELLPDTPELRLERDCEVVAPMTELPLLPDGVWQSIAGNYNWQLEAPEWGPVAAPEEGGPLQTEVAIIDTTPTSNPLTFPGVIGKGISGHGAVMSSVVRNFACPESRRGFGPCTAVMSSVLAMDRGRLPGEFDRGGYYGSILEYAAAVHFAYQRWNTRPPADKRPHLIINLSLGWNGIYGGEISPSARLPERLAFQATREAACGGALIIASAGNRNAPGESGPLYPGAWESTRLNCGVPSTGYDPMVYSVGAVDAADNAMAISRPDGVPALVAPGAHVVVPDDTLFDPQLLFGTPVMTGSSLSAAAVTGAAALVWGHRPEWSAKRVMRTVYRGAEPLGADADYGLGQPRGQRRVSVCGALHEACQNGAGRCPDPNVGYLCPDRRPAGVDAGPDWSDAEDYYFSGLPNDPTPLVVNPDPVESVDVLTQPWVVPQPGVVGCPLCGISGLTLWGRIHGDPLVQWGSVRVEGIGIKDNQQINVSVALPNLFLDKEFSVDLEPAIGNVQMIQAAFKMYNGEKLVSTSDLVLK